MFQLTSLKCRVGRGSVGRLFMHGRWVGGSGKDSAQGLGIPQQASLADSSATGALTRQHMLNDQIIRLGQ